MFDITDNIRNKNHPFLNLFLKLDILIYMQFKFNLVSLLFFMLKSAEIKL